MSIVNLAGIETEFGIILEGEKNFNPLAISNLVLNNANQSNTTSWNNGGENEPTDTGSDSSNITFSQATHTNIALVNGARFYVDHAHPEFSTPECIDLKELIASDKAGEVILYRAMENANKKLSGQKRIQIYKNNSDHKGNSYGCHENYLISASVYQDLFGNKLHKIFLYLVPFLVTRQIFCGAGKVGIENETEPVDFQISQRADFFETVIGLQTTHNRPIINTRDEPHADPMRFRRLHVIVGDANMSEYSTFLKVGTTQIVLQMIEDDLIKTNLTLENPVRAIREVSHHFTKAIKLEDGREMTAIEIQEEYLQVAQRYFEKNEPTPVQKEIIREWEDVLKKLKDDPMQLNRRVDWVIKKCLLEAQMKKKNIDWNSPILKEIDIRYHDIRRDVGIFYILQNEGLIDRIIDDRMIQSFVSSPPVNTRAYFRGKCIEKFFDQIAKVDWEKIEFLTGDKIFLLDPTSKTKAEVDEILEESTSVKELIGKYSDLER